jgi:hypothetical protein
LPEAKEIYDNKKGATFVTPFFCIRNLTDDLFFRQQHSINDMRNAIARNNISNRNI